MWRVFVQGVPDKSMRVGLYARISTNDQQTLPMQLEMMRRYAADRGWTVLIELQEVGSGVKDRPQRATLMKAARRREIDAIVVWKLDRFGRSLADLVLTLRELVDLGVAFVSLTEGFDLTTATGRAMAGMVSVFAEFERELIRERVKAGIAHARVNGKQLGRPRTVVTEAGRIRQLHTEGKNKSEIARLLAVSRASVWRCLRD
jgi:putative DNA-invertase from lambdoid prophage Rac